MTTVLPELLDRMAALEHAAFVEFEEAFCDPIIGWLADCGLCQEDIEIEAPRCVFNVGLLIAKRRDEIEAHNIVEWLRLQTRNLTVRYWRDATYLAHTDTDKPDASRVASLTSSIDGTPNSYTMAARTLDLPTGWLRRRYARLQAGLDATFDGRLPAPT